MDDADNWLIRNTKDDTFWSCCIGWVDYSHCQVFFQEEKDPLSKSVKFSAILEEQS